MRDERIARKGKVRKGEGKMIEDQRRSNDLMQRTKALALQVATLGDSLPNTRSGRIFGDQALRSGASVGAHYGEGHRVRSTAEFISKLEVGIQELPETMYWHELIQESKLATKAQVEPILSEADELIRILIAPVKTAKSRSGLKSHRSSTIDHRSI